MSARRTILSSVAGILLGGLTGAALFGVPTYLSTESGFLGPDSDWAWFAASVGFVVGVLPGAVIGSVTALLRPHPFVGALIGTGVGFLVLVVLSARGLDPDAEIFLINMTWIPICGAIGFALALVNRQRAPAQPNKPSDRSANRVFGNLLD